MTENDIRTFLAVCRQRTLSQAAEELIMTRQAVSKQIQKIEAQLGTELFVRSRNGLSLTSAGQQYYELFHGFIEAFDGLKLKLAAEKAASQDITIGYISGCDSALDCILVFVQSFQAKTGIRVNLLCIEPSMVKELLAQGKLDIAICFDLPWIYEGKFCAKRFIQSPRVLMVSRHNPSVQTASSYLDFEGETLLGWKHPKESDAEALVNLQKNSACYGFHPKDFRILPNLESANTALRLNDGVALGTAFTTISSSEDIVTYPLSAVVDLMLIWNQTAVSASVSQFLNALEQESLPITI